MFQNPSGYVMVSVTNIHSATGIEDLANARLLSHQFIQWCCNGVDPLLLEQSHNAIRRLLHVSDISLVVSCIQFFLDTILWFFNSPVHSSNVLVWVSTGSENELMCCSSEDWMDLSTWGENYPNYSQTTEQIEDPSKTDQGHPSTNNKTQNWKNPLNLRQRVHLYHYHTAKRLGKMAQALYVVGSWFESQSGHQPSWLKILRVSSVPLQKLQNSTFNQVHPSVSLAIHCSLTAQVLPIHSLSY